MTAFWMTWKPEGWPIERLRDLIGRFQADPETTEPWRILAHRQARIGDRVYLFKQGKGPRGIFGVGTIASEPALDAAQSLNPDHPQHFVDVRFVELLDPTQSMLLDLGRLEDIVPASRIRSQASGTTISDKIGAELDRRLGLPARPPSTETRRSLRALTRDAVIQAIQEFDVLGRDDFLKTYGYGEADGYWVIYDQGRYDRYDSKAIVGVAFKHITGINRPLHRSEFSGGRASVLPALQRLGFEVEVNPQAGPGIRRPASMDPQEADNEPFDPTSITDARERVFREIRARRGQKQFRDVLIDAYGGRCAITGCDVLDVLEAAHITPYLGPETNHVTNGLLLRADLHTLFDTNLVAVDPETRKALVSPTIKDPAYRALHGQALRATKTKASAPSEAALSQHREGCGF